MTGVSPSFEGSAKLQVCAQDRGVGSVRCRSLNELLVGSRNGFLIFTVRLAEIVCDLEGARTPPGYGGASKQRSYGGTWRADVDADGVFRSFDTADVDLTLHPLGSLVALLFVCRRFAGP